MIRFMSRPTLLSLSAVVPFTASPPQSNNPAPPGMAVGDPAMAPAAPESTTPSPTSPSASSTSTSTSGAAIVPININTATDAQILAIPGVGPRMLREFKEYRPWTSLAQFRREIGKYVDKAEVARLEQYIVIK